MYFHPTDKAKAVLRDWHQVCVEGGSNNQPAWNKVRPLPAVHLTMHAPALPQLPVLCLVTQAATLHKVQEHCRAKPPSA